MASAEDLVLQWIRSDPKFTAWARSVVAGDEFAYGDEDFHEALYDMLYANDALSWYSFASPGVVRARNDLRLTLTQEEFDGIDWSKVREILLSD